MDNPAPQQPEQGDARLQEYFELCQRIYERHVREGTWPWPDDSTNPEDMVDSESNSHDL